MLRAGKYFACVKVFNVETFLNQLFIKMSQVGLRQENYWSTKNIKFKVPQAFAGSIVPDVTNENVMALFSAYLSINMAYKYYGIDVIIITKGEP